MNSNHDHKEAIMRISRIAFLITLAVALFCATAMHAGEGTLREEDNGLYGFWLRVGGDANTLGLLREKNAIPLAELHELGNGMRIAYEDKWLEANYRPSRRAILLAEEIFTMDDVPVSTENTASAQNIPATSTTRATEQSYMNHSVILELTQQKNDATAARIMAEEALKQANLRIHTLEGEVGALEESNKTLAQANRPTASAEFIQSMRRIFKDRPFWIGFLGVIAGSTLLLFAYLAWRMLGPKSRIETDFSDDILRQDLTLRAVSLNGTPVTFLLASVVTPEGGGDGEPRWKCPFCSERNLTTKNALNPHGHMKTHALLTASETTVNSASEESPDDEMVMAAEFRPHPNRFRH